MSQGTRDHAYDFKLTNTKSIYEMQYIERVDFAAVGFFRYR